MRQPQRTRCHGKVVPGWLRYQLAAVRRDGASRAAFGPSLHVPPFSIMAGLPLCLSFSVYPVPTGTYIHVLSVEDSSPTYRPCSRRLSPFCNPAGLVPRPWVRSHCPIPLAAACWMVVSLPLSLPLPLLCSCFSLHKDEGTTGTRAAPRAVGNPSLFHPPPISLNPTGPPTGRGTSFHCSASDRTRDDAGSWPLPGPGWPCGVSDLPDNLLSQLVFQLSLCVCVCLCLEPTACRALLH